MSNLSNVNGRAYEFAYLLVLEKKVAPYRNLIIEKNNGYFASRNAWNLIDNQKRTSYLKSANVGLDAVFDAEPLILDEGDDALEAKIQADSVGEEGDVRDIVLMRRGIHWEIGLSIKHNHFAVKHSRLSDRLDFGERWFGIKCSNEYWDQVNPIFQYLSKMESKKVKWCELPAKEKDVYLPLLNAFLNEVKRSYSIHGGVIAKKLVEYLIGRYDFYKLISIDKERITQIQPFNLRKTLNKEAKKYKQKLIIPVSELPTRMVSAGIKRYSNNTAEIHMDEGWQFGFRIHNAEKYVMPSLKFDVQIIGMPATIKCVNRKWA